MEDQAEYSKREKVNNMEEILRIYYDKNNSSFNEIILIDSVIVVTGIMSKWKIFKAYPSNVGSLMICKN